VSAVVVIAHRLLVEIDGEQSVAAVQEDLRQAIGVARAQN
jgi:hypothetical protein